MRNIGPLLIDAGHFSLSCLYAILIVFTLYMRFFNKTHNRKLIWHRTFSYALLFGIIARSIAFFIQPFINNGEIDIPNKYAVIFVTLPAFIFFSCYLLILFLWIEIYNDISGLNTRFLKPIFFITQGLMYLTLFTLYTLNIVLNFEKKPKLRHPFSVESPFEKAIHILISCIYFFSAIGFLIYGSRFYCNLTREKRPLLARFRQTVLPTIRNLTIICSFCFIVRGVLTFSNGIVDWPRGKWWVDPFYFLFLEIIPIVLMIVVLKPSTSSSIQESRTDSSETESE